jgi:hypothetical protein
MQSNTDSAVVEAVKELNKKAAQANLLHRIFVEARYGKDHVQRFYESLPQSDKDSLYFSYSEYLSGPGTFRG